MSPRRTSAIGRSPVSKGSRSGARTNLFTSTWSPTRSVSSIEALGILNIWNRNVRTNRAKISAITAAWAYSNRMRRGGRGGRDSGASPEPVAPASAAPGPAAPEIAPAGNGVVTGSLHLEEGQERLLGDVHPADLLHALLALLLLLEELALARDVAAVALGEDVLAQGRHVLACDDLAADRRLDRHLEELARDLLAQLGREAAALLRGA